MTMTSQKEYHDAMSVNIALLSPVRLVGDLVSRALSHQQSIRVRAHGTSVTELATAFAAAPEVILTYDGSCAASLGMLRSTMVSLNTPRVVVFGLCNVPVDLKRCIENRVCALVSCDATVKELVAAIQTVANGGSYTSPTLAAALMQALADVPSPATVLTEREHEVAALVARDYSNAAICKELGLRPGTLKSHLRSVYRKLGISYRSDVVSRLAATIHTGHRPDVLRGPASERFARTRPSEVTSQPSAGRLRPIVPDRSAG